VKCRAGERHTEEWLGPVEGAPGDNDPSSRQLRWKPPAHYALWVDHLLTVQSSDLGAGKQNALYWRYLKQNTKVRQWMVSWKENGHNFWLWGVPVGCTPTFMAEGSIPQHFRTDTHYYFLRGKPLLIPQDSKKLPSIIITILIIIFIVIFLIIFYIVVVVVVDRFSNNQLHNLNRLFQ